MESAKHRRTLSKTSNYLDSLATALRDLGGATTIPHELTQNADDAGNATSVRFTVDDRALTVWNDGTFTDCDEDGDDCPWPRRCDLHAFRRFAGRTKAADATTTGAFGVGFTAVYQITDRPELLYGNQHWILDETASENERLRACDGGCTRLHNDPGTTFVLPWARDESTLRKALSVSPVTEETVTEVEVALLEAAKPSILFLHHVSQIEVVTRTRRYQVKAARTAGGASITDDVSSTKWLFLTADFRRQAENLVASSHGLIDIERSSAVTVALPLEADVNAGVLYATLPTQTPSGLPGHANGAFYPTTDRKSVRFENDIYSAWNRAAIAAVGTALVEGAEIVVQRIGITAFWDLLGEIESLSRNTGSVGSDHAKTYLDGLVPIVRDLAVIETTNGTLVMPTDAYLPKPGEAYDASEALNSIRLAAVSKKLHRRLHTNNLYLSFGIQLLNNSHVVKHLMAAGYTQAFLPSSETLSIVEVKQLLELMSRSQGNVKNVDGLGAVAIVPCNSGLIAPASMVTWPSSADESTLFELLIQGLLLADINTINEAFPGLKDLWTPLDVTQAISLLKGVDATKLSELADDLLAWFDRHLLEIDRSNAPEIAALPIFPTSSQEFSSLTALSLPQDFDDPVNVASLVDFETARNYRKLLNTLGAKPLDVETYFLLHVLPAARDRRLNSTQAALLLRLVARYQTELESHKHEFTDAFIIPGSDGELYTAKELHMPTKEIGVLAPELPIADTAIAPAAVFEWLGVSRYPTDEALGLAVSRLSGDGSVDGGEIAVAILHTLEQRTTAETKPLDVKERPTFLASSSWLPLKSGSTAKPADVLPSNARHLYGMQGNELGLSSPVQSRYFAQLTWLGMPARPPVCVVVEHIKHSSETKSDLNSDVYRVLSNNSDDAAVRQLRNVRCVHVGYGKFVLPATSFWGPTPFGRWSVELPTEMRTHQKFFDAVGVQEQPGPTEVAAVLKEIGDEFGNDLLDDEAVKAVHGCWTRLSDLLDHPDATSILNKLGHTRSAVDPRGVLASPNGLFFEDSRGTWERFRLLSNNVVPRVQSTWPALERAGVRRAEELIIPSLIGESPQPDEEIPNLIAERIGAFRRLLNDEQSIIAMQQVRIFRASGLTVKFSAQLYGHSEEILPESTDAIYLHDEGRMVYDESSTRRAIARELARAIRPDDDPGKLAIQLQPVLDAVDAADADATLDDYGFDRMNTEEHEAAWSVAAELCDQGAAPVIEDESEPDISQTSEIAGQKPSGSIRRTLKPGYESDQSSQPERVSELSGNRETGTAVDADTAHTPAHGSAGASSAVAGGGNSPTHNKPEHGGRSRFGRQTRLRSYVLHEEDDGGLLGTLGNEAPDFTPIDVAGVGRVLSYEQRCGRRAVEKDHGNPGFDIESYDTHDNLVRRIEIKSTGRSWSTAGVMLSRRQLQQAREDGNLFWLYVVENAEDDANFQIYRIQDPAGRIDYFGFDDGWKTIAEPDIERDELGSPALQSTRSIFGLL
ncbi:DUF3883 domain-containing protein [Pseudarthrobacter sulfonivorans]|uniref:DUF3883 domain-containing protein n=1 Tax=Pseudarthrobacter sulfonivorans TaxID=121292 RepID=UPI002865CE6A|nr:DUF3883 domain-containing protein [Pseudarthrobacter sulfonivorans]MDR6415578.1 hypothetical protein [Pseudarthrobacter sulfonivorans]